MLPWHAPFSSLVLHLNWIFSGWVFGPRHKAAGNFLCCFSCIMFRCFCHIDFSQKPSRSIFFRALSWRSNMRQRHIGSESRSDCISLRLCQVVFHELVRKCPASTLTLQHVRVCSSLHLITDKISWNPCGVTALRGLWKHQIVENTDIMLCFKVSRWRDI